MKGYWINNRGQASASSVSFLDNNNTTPTVGIAPIIAGNVYNRLLSARCNYLLNVDRLSYSTAQALTKPGGVGPTWNYQIADFTPAQYIPQANWYGYTTTIEPVEGEDGIKYAWKAENTSPVTTAQAYEVKCKVIRMYPLFYTDRITIDSAASYDKLRELVNSLYLTNFVDNTKLNLPTFEGNLVQGSSGSSVSNVTMKQNKHYAGFGKKQSAEYLYQNGLYFPHYNTRYSTTYPDAGVGPLDVSMSPFSMTRNNIVIDNNSSGYTTDIAYNSSIEEGLPFFLNLCTTATGYLSQTAWETNSVLPFSSLDNLYGDNCIFNPNTEDMLGYKIERGNITPLPQIKNNQVVHFGDGLGVLDSTYMSQLYFANRYIPNEPFRHCYIDTNRSSGVIDYVYFIITYLTNNIITLTKNPNADGLYLHWTFNRIKEMIINES